MLFLNCAIPRKCSFRKPAVFSTSGKARKYLRIMLETWNSKAQQCLVNSRSILHITLNSKYCGLNVSDLSKRDPSLRSF